ncbi:MAG: hypothetical protein ABJC07_12645 [Acidobacteriota bacterium]
MTPAIELQTGLAQERWRKAVDALWREVLYYRRARLADRERDRAERRLRNLRRIVRHALSEYHRLQVETTQAGTSRH